LNVFDKRQERVIAKDHHILLHKFFEC
jgi:hypothetical protein